MAIITFPAGSHIATIDWTLRRPAQVNRSQWTGRDQVRANPWHGRWLASFTLAPHVGEENILAWRAFIAAMKGPVNTCRLPATEGAQTASANVLVSGAHAAGVTSIAFSGGPVSTTLLEAGRMITIGDQLMVLTAAATTNGAGAGSFTVEPPLRAAAANGATIEIQRPTAIVALADPDAGWGVSPGKVYGMKLDVEERL